MTRREASKAAVCQLMRSTGDFRERLENAAHAFHQVYSAQAGFSPAEQRTFAVIDGFLTRTTSDPEQIGTHRASIRTLNEQERLDLAGAFLDFYDEVLRKEFWDRPRDPREEAEKN